MLTISKAKSVVPSRRRVGAGLSRDLLMGCLLGLGTFVAMASTVSAEEWTSLENNQTVQGAFLGMWQDNVVLRLSNGRRVVVAKAKLTAESRMQADDLAAAMQQNRQRRIDELSASSSSTVMPTVEPAKPYNALPQSAGLKEFVEAASKELEAGHVRVLWDALPTKFQNDLKEVVQLANQSGDDQAFLVNQRLAAQLGRTLLAQREFFFNYPAMEQIPPPVMDMVRKMYSPTAGIISVMGDKEVMSFDMMKEGNLDSIIANMDEKLAPHIAEILRNIPIDFNPLASLTNINANAVTMDADDVGSIRITTPDGQDQTLQFLRIDGKWLPKGMASDWDNLMVEVRQQANVLAPEASAGAVAAAGMFGAALGTIESAETQEEFNDVLDMYVGTIMGAIGSQMSAGGQPGFNGPMGGGGMAGPGMNQPGMNQPGMNQPGMNQPGMAGAGAGGNQPGMAGAGMRGPGTAGAGGIAPSAPVK
jgi:hypothetical protein